MESADPSVLRPWCRPCRIDLLVTQVRRRRFGIILRSTNSRESMFSVRGIILGLVEMPYSIPGAFIAQIAAMNRAFARGRMVIVSANAVRGQTVILTKSGH